MRRERREREKRVGERPFGSVVLRSLYLLSNVVRSSKRFCPWGNGPLCNLAVIVADAMSTTTRSLPSRSAVPSFQRMGR